MKNLIALLVFSLASLIACTNQPVNSDEGIPDEDFEKYGQEFKGKIDLAIDLNDIRGRRCRY